jgi:uncharacterized protein
MTQSEDLHVFQKSVDGIPVQWVLPAFPGNHPKMIIFLPSFGGSNKQVIDLLRSLALQGFLGLSFDPLQHGDRGSESREQLMRRVFSSFRLHMWPILGQTTIDVLRIINWAIAELNVSPSVRIGGLSMGGDVAVAAAGLDSRIERVVSVVATPDWLRPGMHDAKEPTLLIDQGRADALAQYFYDTLDPISHLNRYRRKMKITFICGDQDNHVPADGAQRFRSTLACEQPESLAVVDVEMIHGLAHLDVLDRNLWWPDCQRMLTADS